MNKQELEKLFDEADLYIEGPSGFLDDEKVKEFIFGTVIGEVLKSLIYNTSINEFDDIGLIEIEELKQKAKELYNIDL